MTPEHSVPHSLSWPTCTTFGLLHPPARFSSPPNQPEVVYLPCTHPYSLCSWSVYHLRMQYSSLLNDSLWYLQQNNRLLLHTMLREVPFISGGTLTVIALKLLLHKIDSYANSCTNQYFLTISCRWKSCAIHRAAPLCLVRIRTPDVALTTQTASTYLVPDTFPISNLSSLCASSGGSGCSYCQKHLYCERSLLSLGPACTANPEGLFTAMMSSIHQQHDALSSKGQNEMLTIFV